MKTMKIAACLAGLALVMPSFGQKTGYISDGLEFEECICTEKRNLPLAAQERIETHIPSKYVEDLDKPVLAVFSASWCGPCRMLERKVFTDARVDSLMRLYNVLHIDAELPDGKLLSRLCGGISVYPTCLILNREGYIIDTMAGYQKADVFSAFLEENLQRMDRGLGQECRRWMRQAGMKPVDSVYEGRGMGTGNPISPEMLGNTKNLSALCLYNPKSPACVAFRKLLQEDSLLRSVLERYHVEYLDCSSPGGKYRQYSWLSSLTGIPGWGFVDTAGNVSMAFTACEDAAEVYEMLYYVDSMAARIHVPAGTVDALDRKFRRKERQVAAMDRLAHSPWKIRVGPSMNFSYLSGHNPFRGMRVGYGVAVMAHYYFGAWQSNFCFGLALDSWGGRQNHGGAADYVRFYQVRVPVELQTELFSFPLSSKQGLGMKTVLRTGIWGSYAPAIECRVPSFARERPDAGMSLNDGDFQPFDAGASIGLDFCVGSFRLSMSYLRGFLDRFLPGSSYTGRSNMFELGAVVTLGE